MGPYNEDNVKAAAAKVREEYRKVDREPDAMYPVWPCRMVYDYCDGLPWEYSVDKHMRELREALGIQEELPEVVVGPLAPNGRQLLLAGRPFDYKAVSAFGLPLNWSEQTLEWWAQHGVTVLRVFTMFNGGLGFLAPADGLFRVGVLAAAAAKYGLYVQAVGLADTKAFDMTEAQGKQHLNALFGMQQQHVNIIPELANEPWHPTQQSWVAPLVKGWQGPATVAWGVGASSNDESAECAGGTIVYVHLDRGRPKWERERRVRELENLSRETGKFVVSNEPIGADELAEAGRRESDPACYFAQGLLARVFGVGTCFHFQLGLRGLLPSGNQATCFGAWIHGLDLLEGFGGEFRNVGWTQDDTPIKTILDPTIVRAYSLVNGGACRTVVLGKAAVKPEADLEWRGGFAPVPPMDCLGEVAVVRAVR